MNIKPLFVCLPLLGLVSANAELDRAYFDRLHTEQVPSSDRVTWRQVGPGMSGYCEAFWCHPTDTQAMFMSPDMFNSYGSWDGGKSWLTIKNCDGDGRDLRRVQAMDFSRQDPDFGFCTTIRGQLYRTTDRGRSWQLVEDFPKFGSYYEMAVDPTDDHIWYLGAGDFWNVKFLQRKLDRSKQYRGKQAAYGFVLKSTDRGRTWRKLTKGLPDDLDVGRIIVDPTNPRCLIVAADSGVYRSEDGGESWHESAAGLPTQRARDLTSYHDPASGAFILFLALQPDYEPAGKSVASRGGIFKSLDHGVTWIDITGNLPVDLNRITSRTARNFYFRAMANWFGLSPDEAQRKFPDLPAAILNPFHRIRVNPRNPDELYLSQNVKHDQAFLPGDVWKSTDGGKTWIAAVRSGTYWASGTDADYWASRRNPTGVNTTFAHLQPGISRREENHGNRFLEVNRDGDLFACLDQQVMRSTDRGANWQQADDIETSPGSQWWIGRGDSNLPGRYMLLETGRKDRYLLCSGEHGLWQTGDLSGLESDGPVPVRQIEGQRNPQGAVSIATVAVHPHDPDTIYILVFRQEHRGFLRRSTDGGKTWHDVGKIFDYTKDAPGSHLYQYSLTIDPEDPDTMYFCLTDHTVTEVGEGRKIPRSEFDEYGVFKSSDGGKTWSRKNSGLPTGGSVNRLTMDPTNPSVLYAALNESRDRDRGGLYKSTDRAEHWEKVTIPSPITAVNHVFVDRNNHHLFISCGTARGQYEEGGVWRSRDDGRSWDKIFDLPWIWHTETSPLNPDIITVSAGGADNVPPVQIPEKPTPRGAALNPGAYLSLDGGATWMKINRNLGQPDRIVEIKPDPTHEDILWCALWGSGWAVGRIERPPTGTTGAAVSRAWDVRDFGAKGDGRTKDTSAIQAAIDACAAAGGGKVSLTRGDFVSGTILLRNDITLHVAADARLLGSDDPRDYRSIDPFVDATGQTRGKCLIGALDSARIAITGPGIIDGRGENFLAEHLAPNLEKWQIPPPERKALGTDRPFLLRFVRSTDITLHDVQLRQPAAWTCHFFQCERILASGISIYAHAHKNNDGIDIDSSTHVLVENCRIETGDDAVCLKTTSPSPTSHVTVRDCDLKSDWGAFKIGTESMGDVHKIRVERCRISDTRGGGIKILSADGANIHDVTLSDITMTDVDMPVFISLGERLRTYRGAPPQTVGSIDQITIRNVSGTARAAARSRVNPPTGVFITGTAAHPIGHVRLEDISLALPGGGTDTDAVRTAESRAKEYPEFVPFGVLPAHGLYARHIRELSTQRLNFTLLAPDARPAVIVDDDAIDAANRPALPVGRAKLN